MISLWLLLLALEPHEARKRPVGSQITLTGFVTVPSGVFSSFRQDNGFVLGDVVTGIYVATDNKGYRSLGSAVEVHGTLADDGHGMLIFRARRIEPLKGRRLIRPWKHDGQALSEFHEGKLLETEGEVVRYASDLPYGNKLFLQRDGREIQVFLPAQVRLPEELVKPGRRLRVVGFCAQYDRIYEIVPRSVKDVKGL